MAAAALIVVIFSAADSTQSELLQLQDLSAGQGGGYALPPGYEGRRREPRPQQLVGAQFTLECALAASQARFSQGSFAL